MKSLVRYAIIKSSSREQITKAKGRKQMKSKVMTIANNLVKQGMTRRAAMIQAWITVKLRSIVTRAAGVTYGNRQKLLSRLARYTAEQITITLCHEQGNRFDRNAVQVIAGVKGKGSAVIGYLNRQLAAVVAPLIDKGKSVVSSFRAVTGGAEQLLTYGLNISITV